ncbi:MAG: hypothetical protein AAFQ58_24090 [Pseudomonadota bacterium]
MTAAPPQDTEAPPTLTCDWQDWLSYLEEVDATDAEKRQLIETLWAIVVAFVDLGWDVEATSETCGQTLDLKAALTAAVLHSTHTKQEQEDA